MPLHTTYRPNSIVEVFGNDSVKTAVSAILSREEDIPRAWLFTGPSGCGKTTMARIIANTIGCSERDYQELNIADARGIDDARKLIHSMNYMPQGGNVRVFVLDEVQQALGPFQNALLKALEDTPDHVVWILCTTDPDKLLKTIRTRCSTFEMRSLPGPVMRNLINWVLESEGVTNFPAEAVDDIVLAADGSPRQALVILDQVIDIQDNQELRESIKRNLVSLTSMNDVFRSLLEKKGWNIVSNLISGLDDNDNWEGNRKYVLVAASNELLKADNSQAATIINCFKDNLYDSGKAGFVLAAWRCLL